MRLTDLSGEQDVGLSCHLAEIGPFRVLIDAGFHPQKEGVECTPNLTAISETSLDFVILTHCHLDHLGALPIIKRLQPHVDILCSTPTASIAPRMLQNSHKIMRLKRDELDIKEFPLYSKEDIANVEHGLFPMPFHKTRVFEKEGQALEVTLFPAGHIAGAAGVMLQYKHRKIFFTGDVLFEDQLTLPGADFPSGPFDTLVMECTRGASSRPVERSRKHEAKQLIHTINQTIDRGGSCLVPSFALGRMQEVIAMLAQAKERKELVDVPVFCSGLGLEIIEYFDMISRKTGLVRFRKKLMAQLGAKKLKQMLRAGEDVKTQGIYLLSSGMLVENTPSYAAAAAMLDNHHNSICFVGYCDPSTPGGRLLTKHPDESMVFGPLGHVAKVRAQIEHFDLSAHADREELLQFALQASPRAVVLTHGETEAREWFEEEFAIESPNTKVHNPQPNVEYLV